MEAEKVLYHIIRADEWDKVREESVYAPDSLVTEGFIHCSTEEQLVEVADVFFRGEKDLRILSIDSDLVSAEIVFEDLYETGKLFPHIYGELNLDAVVKVSRMGVRDDGEIELV
ncbi:MULTISPECIES: DUF952 domain-containing protein [unclassified Bacillus (in: firmicutes)]|uniref:DUF952 domain-containing protein n=1 Tax=unclassified Bacillus (in: firmicutes) TaxID=185979 RepID=UPI0008E5E4EE|nr:MULTISPECIES: DUF952 domain-containing protein [unclassified Bacillus (in: firmicutes)]SFB03931.1 Uncharacterized conserved protein, DUF952 family [Bacillus sp. UNCCL13]SFQ88649.1 Uncharacterized conserved protein, DUF952 family [Bacillus sp. cl95]